MEQKSKQTNKLKHLVDLSLIPFLSQLNQKIKIIFIHCFPA